MQQVVSQLHKIDYFCNRLRGIYVKVSPPGRDVVLGVQQETDK